MSVETFAADVVVVGGGIAGLVAGVGAAEAGLDVLVLEASASEEYICSSRLTGGVFHCALRAPNSDPVELAEAIVRGRGPGGNAPLATAIARDTMPAIRWLQAQGARFIKASPDPWQLFVLSPPSLGRSGDGWRGRGGDTLLRLLSKRLGECGGRIYRDRRARELVVNADDRISGIRGTGFEVAASAIVIADGGFQRNRQLLSKAISPRPERLVQRNGGAGGGDGIAMVVAAGGAVAADPAGFYGHVVSRDALHRDDLVFYPWLDELARCGLAVTADGKRFCDEGQGGIHVANRIAALPDPAGATVIWDEAIWQGPGKTRFMAPNPALERRGATVHRAQTLRELAAKAGIDATGLEATVASFNRAIEEGTLQSLFPARFAGADGPAPLLAPPFAAAPAAAGVTYTMAGIEVDASSRVIRTSGEAFPNLFAVGSAAGGAEGGTKPMYIGGLVKAAATGWRAARTIVEQLIDPAETANGPTKDQWSIAV